MLPTRHREQADGPPTLYSFTNDHFPKIGRTKFPWWESPSHNSVYYYSPTFKDEGNQLRFEYDGARSDKAAPEEEEGIEPVRKKAVINKGTEQEGQVDNMKEETQNSDTQDDPMRNSNS